MNIHGGAMGWRRLTGWLALATALGSTQLVMAAASKPEPASPAGRCVQLGQTSLSGAIVRSAETVTGGSVTLADGKKIDNLPALCRVKGTAHPTSRSNIGFEVWLPLENWSGRIFMVGNGGYSPAMRLDLLGNLVRRGSVAVATDTGHSGGDIVLGDLDFGFDNPEAIADWGHRAVHSSIQLGKELTKSFYGRAASHSYFAGCSTGGHQALMSAQRYPEDFDGIIAGAPGSNRTNLNLGFLWQFKQNHERGDNLNPILTLDDMKLVSSRWTSSCDKLDGLADGIVTDPRRCQFKLQSLLCTPGQSNGCLTDRKITAISLMHAGPTRSDTGATIYPGWPLGSEYVEGQGEIQGWHMYWANPAKPDQPQRADYFGQWVFHNPAWNSWTFNWASDVDRSHSALGPIIDANSPNIDAFQRRGGKLIMFSGWQDPVVSADDTISYFQRLSDRYKQSASSFARLYMVPGMGHCALGNGATNFSSANRNSTPLRSDAGHDIAMALERWVESGVAPQTIVAAKYRQGTLQSGLEFTRPLCPYPKASQYKGSGDPNKASSFICR